MVVALRGQSAWRWSGVGEVVVDGFADDGAGGGVVLGRVGAQRGVDVLGESHLAARGTPGACGVGVAELGTAGEDPERAACTAAARHPVNQVISHVVGRSQFLLIVEYFAVVITL